MQNCNIITLLQIHSGPPALLSFRGLGFLSLTPDIPEKYASIFQNNKTMNRKDLQSLPGNCDYCRVGKIVPDFTRMSRVKSP
jgi:hypothetical protein